jgi:hypothetical protein
MFREVYNDFDFGKTVQAVLIMEKQVKAEKTSHQCAVFISQSSNTPIITVTELMTTLFINFITGSSVVSLYSAYTFHRKGLMNYDGPVLPKSMVVTEKFQEAGFQLKTQVKHTRKCGFHHLHQGKPKFLN